MSSREDASDLCARHGLVLREILPSNYGLVARVRGPDGRNLLLKQHQPEQHDCLDEAEALSAWQGCPGIPELVEVYTDGYHLREFVVGVPLSDLDDSGRSLAAECGSLMAGLHATNSHAEPESTPAPWLDVEAAKLASSSYISAAARARAGSLADILRTPAETTLVHGDFYHRNILRTERGLIAIDPLARRDLAAADIATFVLTCPGGEMEPVLDDLLAGYGGTPPAMHEYIEFWALRNSHYRGAFLAAAQGRSQSQWQGCFVADGDGLTWVD